MDFLFTGFQGILGHEFVGEVQEAPPGGSIKQGDRVVGEINIACGQCEMCELGGTAARNHCLNRCVLGIKGKSGCLAEYITLPIKNLYKVPADIPNDVALFAEPLAAAFRIIEQGLIKNDRVAILGDGKLGLLISEALQTLSDKNIVLFGKHHHKLSLAPLQIKTVTACKESFEDYENYFDVTIDATGSANGLMIASSITKPMGTVVLKTTTASDLSNFNSASFVIKEQRIVGSRCGNFSMALHLLATRGTELKKYISKVFPLKEAANAIKFVKENKVLKVQIEMK